MEPVAKPRTAFSQGWWLPLIGVAFFSAAQAASLWLESSIQATTHREGVWYFVQSDFLRGACLAVSLPLIVGVAAFFWRRYPTMAFTAIFIPWIFSINQVVLAAIIWVETSHLFDPARATAPWPTFEAYAPLKTGFAFWLPLLLSLPLILWLQRRLARKVVTASARRD